jgi:hypothetical protein
MRLYAEGVDCFLRSENARPTSPSIRSTSVFGSGTVRMKGECLANGSWPMPTGGGPVATMTGGTGVQGADDVGGELPGDPATGDPGLNGDDDDLVAAGCNGLTPVLMIGVNIERARLVVAPW